MDLILVSFGHRVATSLHQVIKSDDMPAAVAIQARGLGADPASWGQMTASTVPVYMAPNSPLQTDSLRSSGIESHRQYERRLLRMKRQPLGVRVVAGRIHWDEG